MPEGYLNLVLHAHLPFVRHPERSDYLEERWLFEAITESYIPLLQAFHRLYVDDVDFRVTISLSPPLISMLSDALIQSRYQTYIHNLISLAEAEVVRTETDSSFNSTANEYLTRFKGICDFFDQYQGNILPAFAELKRAGKVELITSAATHAFLPYIHTDESLRAQIATAVEVFEEHFGIRPVGMWIPECAYTPRIDRFLKEFGIRYFFVDAHGIESADPPPVFGTFAPILSSVGTAVFARDEESSRQVWDRECGYPGDFDYREYYRDIGHDLQEEYIRPYVHPDGIRVNTGIKYYRITGNDCEKKPYDFQRAREKAAVHAGNFLYNRQLQVRHARNAIGRVPIVTAPYDAELFGHWWYEGPIFLEMLFRKIHYDQRELKTITPSEYLDLYPDFQSCRLGMSTWGRDGYADVWMNSSNDWIYPVLHDCENEMVRLATAHQSPHDLIRRSLNQAARELMLAESSDWAFIMDAKTMVDYAVKRTKVHVNRFRTLADMIWRNEMDEMYLFQLETMDNLFPALDYKLYERKRTSDSCGLERTPVPRLRILMLSWEFPPMTVGGLARHVYDLSRHLVELGCEVHVVTTAIGEYPLYEMVQGVHVHRVRVLQPDGGEFVHFVLQLNLMMRDICRELMDGEIKFDIVHAHDWLVCEAAKMLKDKYNLPLIATMHATEHGRNHGIYTDVQRHIHQLEWELTFEARRVIVCSTYMKQEIQDIFQLPGDKTLVLPNGVDKNLLQPTTLDNLHGEPSLATDDEQVILFIGRLVQEKGVQLLLGAAPEILEQYPNAKFIIMGKGPMLHRLITESEQLGIAHRVMFTGFADDDMRNRLLHRANVAVFPSLYEPFGIVALEAMAAGTPIVAADVGGLSDIVQHERNGLKTYPNDAHSIAEQVKRILGEQDFARMLATAAEQDLSHFDWTNIAARTLDCYHEVCKVK